MLVWFGLIVNGLLVYNYLAFMRMSVRASLLWDSRRIFLFTCELDVGTWLLCVVVQLAVRTSPTSPPSVFRGLPRGR